MRYWMAEAWMVVADGGIFIFTLNACFFVKLSFDTLVDIGPVLFTVSMTFAALLRFSQDFSCLVFL